MKTVIHVTNRLSQPRLGFASPLQKLWIVILNISHFFLFGCVCYVFVPDQLQSKFDKKATQCIFIGYDSQRKGWRCYDPTTGKCYVLRNMMFDEASSLWPSEAVLTSDSKKEVEEFGHEDEEKNHLDNREIV
ncbi:hypothetical protein ACH5RR_041318 [Cinchona calisaya]|uniref:Retroviral polymerase SH3-like domain-containing protein n=1 Tax=Cinchona calisaya TaxID=153742 RepID=A0ABD2XV35_9GENT